MNGKNGKSLSKKTKKQCQTDGCRRVAKFDGYCKKCFESQDPAATVKRLSDMERLNLFDLDKTLINLSQEVTIQRQQKRLEELNFLSLQNKRDTRIREINDEINLLKAQQKQMLESLGKKYQFTPKFASICDKTGVIHENSAQTG